MGKKIGKGHLGNLGHCEASLRNFVPKHFIHMTPFYMQAWLFIIKS